MEELLKTQIELMTKQTALLESLVSRQAAFHFALPVLLKEDNAEVLNKYATKYEVYFKEYLNNYSSVPFGKKN